MRTVKAPTKKPQPMTVRTLAELLASLLLLIPAALLLAWQEALGGTAQYLWLILLVCSLMFLAALCVSEKRRGSFRFKSFLSKRGGFLIMCVFIAYEWVLHLY